MEHHKQGVASLSVAAAVFLVVFKFAVGLATGSLGILSEALHSALDFVAAAITWLCVRVSDKPADRDHNFGHGKIENISALAEAFLLLVTCVWIIWEAVSRLVSDGTQINVSVWSFVVVVLSISVDFWRSRALMKAARKYKSQALEADAIHFSTDIYSSVVVLFGLVCASFGLMWADSVAALGVAVIVIFISWRLCVSAFDNLTDKVPEGARKAVFESIEQVRGVVKWHDLRVRSVGAEYEIDVNIHVDSTLSIVAAHEISEKVEHAVRRRLGSCIINVHVEPEMHAR